MDGAKITELKESIVADGLLQPIGLWQNSLVWGGRRLRAVKELADEGIQIRDSDGTEVPLGEIPFRVFDSTADEHARASAEYAENYYREDLEWNERSFALAEIHRLAQEKNPAQTLEETAEALIVATNDKRAVGAVRAEIAIARTVTAAIEAGDEDVKNAKSLSDAFQITQQKDVKRVAAILSRKRRATMTPQEETIKILTGDSMELMETLPRKSIDLILCDPPYGINADEPNFSRRQAHRHAYSDDPNTIRGLLQKFLLSAFEVAALRANIFIFCDIDHFTFLRDASARMGWTPFRTPIVWDKTSPGIAPWHEMGPQRQSEYILFATKGQRGLRLNWADVISTPRVPTKARIHAAQKPEALLRKLVDTATLPGDMVLDPFMGSGSTLRVCRDLSRRAVGIELDPEIVESATEYVFGEKGNGS